MKKSGMMSGTPDPGTSKSVYKEAYDKEKRMLIEERKEAKEKREESKIRRAAEKAKRDVRNPLYKRIAKKAGAITKEAASAAAVQIGKEVARRQTESELVSKARRKARTGELIKQVAKQERAKVSRRFGEISSRPRLDEGMGDILGMQGKSTRNSITEMRPLGSSKQKPTPILGGGDLLGLGKKKSKKKPDYFGGLL